MRSRVRILAASLLAALALSATAAQSASVSATYTAPDLSVTITSGGGESWDRLEIPIKKTDVLADFTIPAGWTGVVHEDQGVKYLRLTRASSTDITEKVTITGPAGRGGDGTIKLSLAGAGEHGFGTDTFYSIDMPGLPPLGVGLTILLLATAGVFVIQRTRRASSVA